MVLYACKNFTPLHNVENQNIQIAFLEFNSAFMKFNFPFMKVNFAFTKFNSVIHDKIQFFFTFMKSISAFLIFNREYYFESHSETKELVAICNMH